MRLEGVSNKFEKQKLKIKDSLSPRPYPVKGTGSEKVGATGGEAVGAV